MPHTDVDAARLQAVVAAVRARGAACESLHVDVAQREHWQALAARAQALWGGADVLINNAGVALVAPAESVNEADARWLMEINFWGVWHGCRAFAPQLRARRPGLIVNLSSIFAMISLPTLNLTPTKHVIFMILAASLVLVVMAITKRGLIRQQADKKAPHGVLGVRRADRDVGSGRYRDCEHRP